MSFLLEVNSNLSYELEKPFETKDINEKEVLLKKKLEELLLINTNAYKEDNDNYTYEANIQRIERMIEVLD